MKNEKPNPKSNEAQEEQFDLHIRFIGTDTLYWSKLQERFAAAYESLKVKFSLVNPTLDKFNPMHEYLSLIQDSVNILFFETIYGHQKNIDFAKFIRRDEKTKRISTTALHTFNNSEEEISQMTFAGIRVNQIKSDEFSGIIFAAMAIYDAAKTEIPPLLFVPHEKEIYLRQELRLSYLTHEYYNIETHSPLVPGTKFHLEEHPLKKILPKCEFEVRALREENLYYYKRYSLKVWPVLEDPKYYEKKILSWISSAQGKLRPKKTKILLADPYLVWFKNLDKSIMDLDFTVNFQTKIETIENVLKRRRPQIICLAIDNEDPNSIVAARRLLTKVKSLSIYEPYLLIVNCPVPTETLKKSLQYEKIMALKHLIKPEELNAMANSLEKNLVKNQTEEEENRVYFKSSEPHIKINFNREIRLLGMTESMIYFQSEQVIPDYTVFKIDNPVEALVTTVPHFKVELMELPKPYYIGIINCTGESANSKLRNYLNLLIKESQETPEEEAKEAAQGEPNKEESPQDSQQNSDTEPKE